MSYRPAMPSDRSPDSAPPPDEDPRIAEVHHRHWRSNVRLTLVLLAVWAAVGLGCGVLFADALNEFTLLGFPVGFWFAQQGSIVTFVVLILIYALAMMRLDRRLDGELRRIVDEDREPSQ